MFRVLNRTVPLLLVYISIIYIIKNYQPNVAKYGKICKRYDFQHKESYLAHLLLDDLEGVEIGGALHNPFCLNTINVDLSNTAESVFKKKELKVSKGAYLHVDVEAPGDKLPFKNESYDFVISSHVIEHFIDPIKAIEEWFRVIKPNGYIFIIAPHKERTVDSPKNRTTLNELLLRHKKEYPNPVDGHHNIWITEDVLELARNQKWKVVASLDVDDKVGNGFMIVLQKSNGTEVAEITQNSHKHKKNLEIQIILLCLLFFFIFLLISILICFEKISKKLNNMCK